MFSSSPPVLLGVMALGADFAIIYPHWSLVQKAADAAALAGASQLTGQPGSASTIKPAAVNYVNGYACLNGITDSSNAYPTLCAPGTLNRDPSTKLYSRTLRTPRSPWGSNVRSHRITRQKCESHRDT